jgi:adenosylhomocysteine nucleosidase
MEGAAVAQVCYQFKIPFLIIRSISDSADKNADMDIGKFLKTASDNANILVIQLIESLK